MINTQSELALFVAYRNPLLRHAIPLLKILQCFPYQYRIKSKSLNKALYDLMPAFPPKAPNSLLP